MDGIGTVGLEIAKNVFQVHGVDTLLSVVNCDGVNFRQGALIK